MRLLSPGRPAALLATVLVTALAAVLAAPLVPGPTRAQAAASYNYTEALQKSIYFYEAQQSGKKPAWSRVEWRGDRTLNDGKPAGVDLSGGWYDAGDHVKFGFPMAFTTTMLAWGLVENRSGYGTQLTPMLNNLKWATDYLIAAHPEPETLYVQVGDGSVDHAYWGPPEVIDIKGMSRPVYKITPTCKGTDVVAETAAAMAASSMAFRQSDPSYADTLLTHARQLFTFADTTKGTNGQDTAYTSCVPGISGYYNSTWEGGSDHPGATKMYWDELAWASVWLYRATGTASYLDKAREFYPKMGSEPDAGQGAGGTTVPAYTFGLGWNDKEYGVYALMATLTGEQKYIDDVQRYLDYWTTGYKGKKGTITPGGLAYIFNWASLRMALNTAWVALVYADHLGSGDPLYSRYHDFAKRQVDYALGDNPRHASYMVGFGTNPPTHVQHRAASGQYLGYMSDTTGPNLHVLYGALAGGPDAADAYTDSRTDYVRNEVAIDYNSGITNVLARFAKEYGGTPLADFPAPERKYDEISAGVDNVYTGVDGTSLAVTITNTSNWPPRVLQSGKARYYFTLDGSTSASQVKVTGGDSSGCAVSGPVLARDRTYYAEVDCTGKPIYPGDAQLYRRSTQLRVSVPNGASWDPANDWSASAASHVPVYDGNTLVWGTPPEGTASPS
ncbi:glycoside hydrolase family 9 protein, partial [Microbispora triticiradicis]|uniref:glycoside hydrolase family 9 protein n=1 Tax=Microbispora triticiradicis TaxID=2200763 RepID=UPI001AD75369